MHDVAVIVPSYQSNAQFLRETLGSIVAAVQDVDAQLILVEDGSKETVAPISQEFGFEFLRKDNGGLASARNFGVSRSNSRWLCFCDDDDRYLPSKFKAQLPFSEQCGTQAVTFTASQWFNEESRWGFPFFADEQISERLIFGNMFHVNTVMVSRELFDQIGGFDESLRMLEDWDFWLRVQKAGARFHGIDQVLSEVRSHSAQMSGNQAAMNTHMAQICDRESHCLEQYPGSWNRERTRRFVSAWGAYLRGSESPSWSSWFDFSKRHLGFIQTLLLSVRVRLFRK